MELITISDTYDSKTLEVFAKWKIKFPALDEIVVLDRIEKLPRIGKIGLYIIPYTQQFIPGSTFGIEVEKEVSFSHLRFTTLLGEPLSWEMLKEFKEENSGVLERIEKIVRKETLKELK